MIDSVAGDGDGSAPVRSAVREPRTARRELPESLSTSSAASTPSPTRSRSGETILSGRREAITRTTSTDVHST
ncbi:hypothetical protein ACSBPH_09285 [Microbacterium sp. F51-2R]|uniref:hypothetical protein n=1 Tax=Microbacterium sp. F51-2R TaxID=3445777 RepID=UPI003FA010E8